MTPSGAGPLSPMRLSRMLVPNPIRFAYTLLMGAYITVGVVFLLVALLLMI